MPEISIKNSCIIVLLAPILIVPYSKFVNDFRDFSKIKVTLNFGDTVKKINNFQNI